MLHKDNIDWFKRKKKKEIQKNVLIIKHETSENHQNLFPSVTWWQQSVKPRPPWSGRGNLGTHSHLGRHTMLFSDLWSLCTASLSSSPVSGLKVHFNCFLGGRNKHVTGCRELLLALMSLHQLDKTWFLHLSLLSKPYLQARPWKPPPHHLWDAEG